MSDYNDGLLPEPCLRMDTHFGDEYESVEFGDGTGYVKAAPMIMRLWALHAELDELRDENAKLRELARAAWKCIHTGASCSDCRLIAGGCTLQTAMRELGVEVEP